MVFSCFLKMIIMAKFNAFILKKLIKPHKNNWGKIVQDTSVFKDKLVYDLIVLVRSGGCKRMKRKDKFDSSHLLNVSDHFLGKGVGTDHIFVVCMEKRKLWIKAYTGRDICECPFKESKFVCAAYLRKKPVGICSQVFTKNCSFCYHTFYTIGFQDCL